MNANDERLAVLIVDAVLAHRRRRDTQAINRLLDQVVAQNFPDATPAEVTATVAYVRDAIGAERERRRRLQ